MSKKDYVLLAKCLRSVRPSAFSIECDEDEHGRSSQWRNTVEAVADALRQENPNFDEQMFLEACGLL